MSKKQLVSILVTAALFGHAMPLVLADTSPTLVISEVLANPSSETTDEFIELYNASDQPADLNGWHFTDGDALDEIIAWDPLAHGGIPGAATNTTTIPARSYAVILDPDYNGGGRARSRHYTFFSAGTQRERPKYQTTRAPGGARVLVSPLKRAGSARRIKDGFCDIGKYKCEEYHRKPDERINKKRLRLFPRFFVAASGEKEKTRVDEDKNRERKDYCRKRVCDPYNKRDDVGARRGERGRGDKGNSEERGEYDEVPRAQGKAFEASHR